MPRLFDPKHARLVSVVAATVIALACGTNVSEKSLRALFANGENSIYTRHGPPNSHSG